MKSAPCHEVSSVRINFGDALKLAQVDCLLDPGNNRERVDKEAKSEMLSSGNSNAATRRRFQFQRRRCCSTPAMASLADFPDSFFEEIKVRRS